MFYVEFPPKWETQDLYDLFSPYGSIFIGWINERSAFVALQNTENVKKATAQLIGVSGREYKVYFYTTYINQISKNKVNNNNQIVGTPNNKNGVKEENGLDNSDKKRKNGKKLESNSGSDGSPDRKKVKELTGKMFTITYRQKLVLIFYYLKKNHFKKVMIGNIEQ